MLRSHLRIPCLSTAQAVQLKLNADYKIQIALSRIRLPWGLRGGQEEITGAPSHTLCPEIFQNNMKHANQGYQIYLVIYNHRSAL